MSNEHSPKTFRKKPVEVEAMQLDGTQESAKEVLAWADPLTHGRTFAVPEKGTDRWTVVIETLEGAMAASPGDWIIRGVAGEFYPCRPDIFAQTYDSVSSPGVPPATETVVHVHHHDIEAHAASFNEGYDEAMRQLAEPAPAEPTEEETKAEASAIEAGMGLVDWDLIPERGDPNEAAYVAARGAVKAYAANRFEAGSQDLSALIERLVADARSSGHYNDPSKLAGYAEGIEHAYLAPTASSPVVPAPNETGPWQRIEDVPVGVLQIKDRHGRTWLVVGGTWRFEWYDGNWYEPHTNINAQAPFVAAAEEGRA